MPDAEVAIVVRTKDRPDFLARALASIGGQSARVWECVIVNDGGAPEPVDQLLESLEPEVRARFSVIHAPVSRGRWVSANAGVMATTAPLLVLHDDDDTWHPEFLRRSVDYLAAHPDRGGVVSRIEIVWEERSGNTFVAKDREVFQADLPAPTLSDALLFNRFVPIGFVYRRALHEELGLYDDALPVVGDWAFNLKVLTRGPLDYLGDEPLAYWHQRVGVEGVHGNSVIDARGAHELWDARIRDEALREYVDTHGLGLVLYLTKFIDKRLFDIQAGIAQEMFANSLWRRTARRVRRALPRSKSAR